MPKTIEVRINKDELAATPNVYNRTLKVTQGMQKAGIPVIGDLGLEGFSRDGRLVIEQDFFDLIFTWEDA